MIILAGGEYSLNADDDPTKDNFYFSNNPGIQPCANCNILFCLSYLFSLDYFCTSFDLLFLAEAEWIEGNAIVSFSNSRWFTCPKPFEPIPA